MHRDGRGRCASTPGDRGDVLRDTNAVGCVDLTANKGARCHSIALRGLVVGTEKDIGHEAQLNASD